MSFWFSLSLKPYAVSLIVIDDNKQIGMNIQKDTVITRLPVPRQPTHVTKSPVSFTLSAFILLCCTDTTFKLPEQWKDIFTSLAFGNTNHLPLGPGNMPHILPPISCQP